jgi:uroporphyrinogen-III synthase
MTGLILAIRPEPGCTATVVAGREAGLAIEGCPLFEVRPLAWEPPPHERIDALLIGSANAVRQAGPGLEAFRGKHAFAVGTNTAAAAEAAGLTIAAVGRSGLQPLLATLRPPLTLLRLTGEEHVPLKPPLGVVIETRVAYRNLALPMPEAMAAKLRDGGLVLLHSAAAARHLADECARLCIPRAGIALAALGPRIALAAGEGWCERRSVGEPRDAALLALARDMCHEPRPG